MNLIDMLSTGPRLAAQMVNPHRYSKETINGWKEIYRCIGTGERTAAQVTVKINRHLSSDHRHCVKNIHRRLRKMEERGFVSQRLINVDYSTKPVMTWKRVKVPCL